MTEFAFSDIIDWDSLDEAGRTEILRRPAVMAGERISAVVKDILDKRMAIKPFANIPRSSTARR